MRCYAKVPPSPPCRPPRKHVVDTDIHFYHVPSHADASRKRITQDTEDWRPRTGTTQSRSFRILAQITGTENGGWLRTRTSEPGGCGCGC